MLTAATVLSASMLAPATAMAATAAELYADAQAAFRQGKYTQAIENYKAAEQAGFSDLALFYNLGVSHYKLGHYSQAEAAFATASTSPKLAPLAYYNLGLVARKNGANKDARGWFQQSRTHPTASANLRELAGQALGSMPRRRSKRPQYYVEQDRRGRDFLRFSFDSGFAHDSNIYRAPGSSYVDLSTPTTPTIVPTVQSGTFVPLQANTELRWGMHDNSNFSLKYDFDGRIYTDSAYSNANAFKNKVSLGGRAMIPTKNGYKYFHSQFLVAHYNEDYYNRDDGQDVLVGAIDVSNRFERTKWGPKAYYHRKRGWFGYGFRVEGFINNYAETELDYLDLTHEQYRAGAHVSYYPWEKTEFRIGYDWYHRLYSERKAKDANGIRFTNNDDLEYDYENYQGTLRQKFGRRWSVSLDYKYTKRTDNFEAYDNYDRHTGRGSIWYRGKRFNANAGFTYRTYDFPNAFTFDIITEGQKSLDTTYAHMEMSYRLFRQFTVRVEGQMDVVDASDPRSDYEKDQIAVSLRWTI